MIGVSMRSVIKENSCHVRYLESQIQFSQSVIVVMIIMRMLIEIKREVVLHKEDSFVTQEVLEIKHSMKFKSITKMLNLTKMKMYS